MRFIINKEVVNKEQTEESKNCNHSKIISQEIEGERHRYCEECKMVAHEDGSYAHYCGFEWCRCSC